MLALQAETGASLLVGHSYGGLIALEVARNNKAFNKKVHGSTFTQSTPTLCKFDTAIWPVL